MVELNIGWRPWGSFLSGHGLHRKLARGISGKELKWLCRSRPLVETSVWRHSYHWISISVNLVHDMTKYQPVFNGFYGPRSNRNLLSEFAPKVSSNWSTEVWMKIRSDSFFHGTLRNVQHRRMRFTIAPLTCVLFRTIRNGFRTSRSVIFNIS